MFKKLHRNERGQTALETAIILIAFVVVASVFAFTILAAGSESTERGEEAIYSGLEGVQSSMAVKGAVIAQEGTIAGEVGNVVFTMSLVSGGDPINMIEAADDLSGDNAVVIGYRDDSQFVNEVGWTVAWIGDNDGDNLLEDGELVEVTVNLETSGQLTNGLGPNTEFTIEIKPPSGSIINLSRTTPASVETVMELR
jgi:flagellin FlaB